jgi:hypothetical protein
MAERTTGGGAFSTHGGGASGLLHTWRRSELRHDDDNFADLEFADRGGNFLQ